MSNCTPNPNFWLCHCNKVWVSTSINDVTDMLTLLTILFASLLHNNFTLKFESEQVFCKNKNLILMRYILYIQNIRNIPCLEFRENTKVRIFHLSQVLHMFWGQKCTFWGQKCTFKASPVSQLILLNFYETILTRYIPCFEFCENTKDGIFRLLQGLSRDGYEEPHTRM